MSGQLYFLLIGIVFFIGIESKPLTATPELTKRINDLLELTESEQKFNSVINAYVSNSATLTVKKSVLLKFIDEFLSYQSLRPHIVELYSDYYTLSDINEMIEFYSTPLGKKLIDSSDKIQNRITELVQNQMVKQLPQMTAWFEKNLKN